MKKYCDPKEETGPAGKEESSLNLEFTVLSGGFAVCKLRDAKDADLCAGPFVSLTVTGGEISLVCPEEAMPEDRVAAETGWRCLKILGPLDFSLTGVLAEASDALARRKISLFAVSAFDTDYILVKCERVREAMAALTERGWEYIEQKRGFL